MVWPMSSHEGIGVYTPIIRFDDALLQSEITTQEYVLAASPYECSIDPRTKGHRPNFVAGSSILQPPITTS
jgi:hypothetical protein